MHAPSNDHPHQLDFSPNIYSLADLLSKEELQIPLYQRPYKWTVRHVNDLFSDVVRHAHRSAYRLGTVVLHAEGNRLNLVDGQQRTLTVLLAVKAMLECGKRWKNGELNEVLARLEPTIARFCQEFEFDSDISQENLKLNYTEIGMIVSRSYFTDDLALFFLKRCQVVMFTLGDISEAFQFFDSQNARGKDLDPHDLLKAYHLREFGPSQEQGELMTRTIERWESLESEQLAHFFGNHWFRIRNWSRGCSARYFEKEDTRTFKGVNITDARRYPATQILRIAHFFTDHHGAQYERQIDAVEQPFPFQFDQTILNGRRFFEMTSHYLELARRFTSEAELKPADGKLGPNLPEGALDEQAREIMKLLHEYEGRHRRGDEYVRNLFDCLLLFYIDRFGMEEISRAIEKIFRWAYRLRVEYDRIQLASVDNHALSAPFPFQILRDATHPEDFLRMPVDPPKHRSGRAEDIEKFFN